MNSNEVPLYSQADSLHFHTLFSELPSGGDFIYGKQKTTCSFHSTAAKGVPCAVLQMTLKEQLPKQQ